MVTTVNCFHWLAGFNGVSIEFDQSNTFSYYKRQASHIHRAARRRFRGEQTSPPIKAVRSRMVWVLKAVSRGLLFETAPPLVVRPLILHGGPIGFFEKDLRSS